ncbi:MAG: hypothetical protein SFU83_07960 [Meiothermus sp.]|nr:hypothetical protein [Meiothermus sp.]
MVFLLLLLLIIGNISAHAQPLRQVQIVPTSLPDQPLRSLIEDAVRERGGDLERQHLHLVLAFSTGHYRSDPLGAEAAREMAWRLSSGLLTPGDRISVYAWEMQVYDAPTPSPRLVSQEDLQAATPIRDLFPKSTQPSSEGGHDTEEAIVEIRRRLGETYSDAVVVLLTNSAQSQGPVGRQAATLGATHPTYLAVLEEFDRLGASSATLASAQLAYTIRRPDGSTAERSLDAVVLIPRAFSGAEIAGRTRSEPAQTAQTPPQGSGSGSPLPLLLLAALAAAVGYWVYRSLAGGKATGAAPWVLRVEGDGFEIPGGPISVALQGEPVGKEVLALSGPRYAEGSARALPESAGRLPPVLLARFTRSGRGVRVSAGGALRLYVDGTLYLGGYELARGATTRVRIQGEVEVDAVLGPQPVEVGLRVGLSA